MQKSVTMETAKNYKFAIFHLLKYCLKKYLNRFNLPLLLFVNKYVEYLGLHRNKTKVFLLTHFSRKPPENIHPENYKNLKNCTFVYI